MTLLVALRPHKCSFYSFNRVSRYCVYDMAWASTRRMNRRAETLITRRFQLWVEVQRRLGKATVLARWQRSLELEPLVHSSMWDMLCSCLVSSQHLNRSPRKKRAESLPRVGRVSEGPCPLWRVRRLFLSAGGKLTVHFWRNSCVDDSMRSATVLTDKKYRKDVQDITAF